MSNVKNWYAVYTRPRWEKKVADLFLKKGIEHYCPLNKVKRQWADRKKIIHEPLFPSYVFVKVNNTELIYTKETEGVLNFVYWQGKPAIIRQEEIDIIKRFLSEFETIALESAIINPNDKIRIINGPLMLREGEVTEVRNRTVRVLIPSIGFNLIAEVDKNNVEKLTAGS